MFILLDVTSRMKAVGLFCGEPQKALAILNNA
jgi:hypothetical protein